MKFQICKHDLKALDFEGILTYFRESVPKRFQSEGSLNELFRIAYNFKVSTSAHLLLVVSLHYI